MIVICEQLTSWVPMDGTRTNNDEQCAIRTLSDFVLQAKCRRERKSSVSFHVQLSEVGLSPEWDRRKCRLNCIFGKVYFKALKCPFSLRVVCCECVGKRGRESFHLVPPPTMLWVVGEWVGDSHLGAKDECAKSMWPGGNTTESRSLFTCDSTSRLQRIAVEGRHRER